MLGIRHVCGQTNGQGPAIEGVGAGQALKAVGFQLHLVRDESWQWEMLDAQVFTG